MRLSTAAFLLAGSMLAACGGGRQDGIVMMRGLAPDTSLQQAKDLRTAATFCPGPCGKPIELGTERCPEKKLCGVQIRWQENYTCTSCRGSGACSACRLMEQADGSCYNCRGEGVRIYLGQSKECPNCKGTKKCPICKGSKKCDYCENGKVSAELVKERVRKAAPKEEGAETVPAPKAEEKKPEAAPAPAEEKK